jgi:hypothetical protein
VGLLGGLVGLGRRGRRRDAGPGHHGVVRRGRQARRQPVADRVVADDDSRSQAFSVLRDNGRFVSVMAVGSVAGAVTGGLLLGAVPEAVLVPAVVLLLLISAVKVRRHA